MSDSFTDIACVRIDYLKILCHVLTRLFEGNLHDGVRAGTKIGE